MRCPKCGYNSFDHLDSCKKCGKDLVEFKQSFGIKSVLFPGQMGLDSSVAEAEFDSVADAAVTAATGGAVAAAAVADPVAAEPAAADDGDDFGFDFMGDSADDDDLSFDELFEEAPEDEDIEETIEGPKAAEPEEKDAAEGDDFSFDMPEDDDSSLEDDFGFDPETDSDTKNSDSGTGEGPERPFDLPESSLVVGAPVDFQDEISSTTTAAAIAVEEEISPPAPVETEEVAEEYIFEEEPAVAATPQPVKLIPSIAEERPIEAPAVTSVADETSVEGSTVVASEPVEIPPEVSPPVISPLIAPVGEEGNAPSLAGSIGAFVCDFVIIAVVAISFIIAAEAAMSSHESHFLPSLETLVDLSIPYFLVIFFLAFGYFTLFHFLVGQTPGKMLTGLRVETVDGEPLVFAQAFLRSVGGLLQLLPVGLGYLLVLMSPERRGWNDRLAGTRVVALRRSP